MITGVLVDPTERTIGRIDVELGDALQGVQAVVGGFAELIPLALVIPRHAMFVNEDARMLKEKPPAWRLAGNIVYGPAFIVGTNGVQFVDSSVRLEAVEELVQWLPFSSEQASGA